MDQQPPSSLPPPPLPIPPATDLPRRIKAASRTLIGIRKVRKDYDWVGSGNAALMFFTLLILRRSLRTKLNIIGSNLAICGFSSSFQRKKHNAEAMQCSMKIDERRRGVFTVYSRRHTQKEFTNEYLHKQKKAAGQPVSTPPYTVNAKFCCCCCCCEREITKPTTVLCRYDPRSFCDAHSLTPVSRCLPLL